MAEQVPDELSRAAREMYAAREALLEAARNYDGALSRYMSAWVNHRERSPTSGMPGAVAAGRAAIYEDQLEGAREHKQALSPILKLLARKGAGTGDAG
jgi:hypothetical protein